MLPLPRLSIVTANLNQGGFLRHAIHSVLSQGYPDLEYIIVDGGSSDQSADIISRYANQLAFHCSEPDKGHYDAVNKGFAVATGDIMAFLNSDDKYFPGALRAAGEIFATHPNVDWITSLLPSIWDTSGYCVGVSETAGFSKDAFLDGCYGGAQRSFWVLQQESCFWRRSLWQKVGSRLASDISLAADFDLWGRFFEHAELYGVKTLLAGFRFRDGQRGQAEGCDYATQSASRLHEFRRYHSWTPHRRRQLTLMSNLFATRLLGGALRRLIGYRGKRIVRANAGSNYPSWEIEEHLFP